MADSLSTETGGIHGEGNIVGSKDVQYSRGNPQTVNNTVRVDIEALEDVKAEIRDIKLKHMFIERDIAELREGQKENRATLAQVNAKVDALKTPQAPPVTLFQVIIAIVSVVAIITVVLLMGMYMGGMR